MTVLLGALRFAASRALVLLALVAMIVTPAAAQAVTGQTARMVDYGAGAFVQIAPGSWAEVNKTTWTPAFQFAETARTESEITLFDPGRRVNITLRLSSNEVLYSPEGAALQPLYGIVGTAAQSVIPGSVVVWDSPTSLANLPPNTQTQCVNAVFGIGYVAVVNWYNPINVIYDPVTNATSLRPGATAFKSENVSLGFSSCVTENVRMVATISVLGGDIANQAITIAVGTIVAITSGVAGAVVCVGTVGAGCPGAAAAIGAATSGAAAAMTNTLPEAAGMFYIGAPGIVDVAGTVWVPTATETRAWGGGGPINATCTADTGCSNNTCARGSAADGAGLLCCPSGQAGMYGGYYYCYGMTSGSTCWSDAMCSSNYCGGNLGGLQRGTCR